ncbi:hypothetical protein H0A36_10470 [Endozoicomonas sp. SM1973]|uniref:Transcriptional regulator SutA RNAP-binding domain-containing protein n=1 Tax=Spartinivicinus marinus TaxID=2994442 RepID=A0A853HZ16_9GAMM|nr:hypothetical protein [Spartinivicinus marinus]MCX4027391.1 hypothetical protein [Spartinivicinus marinus]NYZ66433.1 hypothetical protein [Spartinivicinus marinus]
MAREQGTTPKKRTDSDWGSRGGDAETYTVQSRKKVREVIEKQIEEFLDSGGKIQEIETGKTGDHSVH